MPQWVCGPDKYVCTLPRETQLVAFKELRETQHTRDEALGQMRDWIMKNPRIVNCRLGKYKPETTLSRGP
jgi:hypothetical protein